MRVLVEEGPSRIRELIDFGVQFNHEGNGDLALTKEGGHSRRRIAFHQDLTGKEIERALVQQATDHPGITIFENHIGIDFAKSPDESEVCGVYVLDTFTGQIETFKARHSVMLATGGCGHIYTHTTNPPIATGDGVAMAFRAGAKVANMEFMQFHPNDAFLSGRTLVSHLRSRSRRGGNLAGQGRTRLYEGL